MKKVIIISIVVLISFSSCDNVNELHNHLKTEEIIFCSIDSDSNATNIYMMNDNGKIVRNITKASWGKYAASAISPSGDSLLFYQAWPGFNIDVPMDIYIYNIKEDVISGPIIQGQPGNFSPDGKIFTFARFNPSDDGGYSSIHLYDLITHTEKRLTKAGYHCFNANISPEGDKICFQSAKFLDRDSISTWQLHVMNIDGTNIIDLTEYKDSYYSANGIFNLDGNSILCDLRINASLLTNIVKIDLSTKALSYLTSVRKIESILWADYQRPTLSKDTNKIYFEVHIPDPQLQRMRTEIWWIYNNSSEVSLLYRNSKFSSVHPIAGVVTYSEDE